MSSAITGISAVPVELSFSVFQYAGGASSQLPQAKASTDQGGTTDVAATGTVRLSSVSQLEAASPPSVQPTTAVASKAFDAPVKSDTVTLSTDAKVRELRSQGEADTQIAATLNLPIKEVDSYLHVISDLTQILAAVTSGAISGTSV